MMDGIGKAITPKLLISTTSKDENGINRLWSSFSRDGEGNIKKESHLIMSTDENPKEGISVFLADDGAGVVFSSGGIDESGPSTSKFLFNTTHFSTKQEWVNNGSLSVGRKKHVSIRYNGLVYHFGGVDASNRHRWAEWMDSTSKKQHFQEFPSQDTDIKSYAILDGRVLFWHMYEEKSAVTCFDMRAGKFSEVARKPLIASLIPQSLQNISVDNVLLVISDNKWIGYSESKRKWFTISELTCAPVSSIHLVHLGSGLISMVYMRESKFLTLTYFMASNMNRLETHGCIIEEVGGSFYDYPKGSVLDTVNMMSVEAQMPKSPQSQDPEALSMRLCSLFCKVLLNSTKMIGRLDLQENASWAFSFPFSIVKQKFVDSPNSLPTRLPEHNNVIRCFMRSEDRSQPALVEQCITFREMCSRKKWSDFWFFQLKVYDMRKFLLNIVRGVLNALIFLRNHNVAVDTIGEDDIVFLESDKEFLVPKVVEFNVRGNGNPQDNYLCLAKFIRYMIAKHNISKVSHTVNHFLEYIKDSKRTETDLVEHPMFLKPEEILDYIVKVRKLMHDPSKKKSISTDSLQNMDWHKAANQHTLMAYTLHYDPVKRTSTYKSEIMHKRVVKYAKDANGLIACVRDVIAHIKDMTNPLKPNGSERDIEYFVLQNFPLFVPKVYEAYGPLGRRRYLDGFPS